MVYTLISPSEVPAQIIRPNNKPFRQRTNQFMLQTKQEKYVKLLMSSVLAFADSKLQKQKSQVHHNTNTTTQHNITHKATQLQIQHHVTGWSKACHNFSTEILAAQSFALLKGLESHRVGVDVVDGVVDVVFHTSLSIIKNSLLQFANATWLVPDLVRPIFVFVFVFEFVFVFVLFCAPSFVLQLLQKRGLQFDAIFYCDGGNLIIRYLLHG